MSNTVVFYFLRMAGSIVLNISYGYNAKEEGDPLLEIAEEATSQAAEVARPGAYFVDVFPFRKYLRYDRRLRVC